MPINTFLPSLLILALFVLPLALLTIFEKKALKRREPVKPEQPQFF
jgi:hypothetical protein